LAQIKVQSLQNILNNNRTQQIFIGLLLITAFLVRCIFFSGGVRGSDAFAYAQIAYDIASGQYDLYTTNMICGFRYSVLLPTALSFACLGVNDIAATIFPFTFSLLNVLVVFQIGKKLFHRDIAIISAFLLIFYPLDICTANILSPDSFIPFFSSLAILFYIMAEEKSALTSRRKLYLILSGILIAFSYMSRVSSIFLFISLAIFQIYHKKYTSFVWTTVGLFIPLAMEALYFYVSTGDPFFEFHRITDLSIAYTIKYDNAVGLLFYPKIMFGFDLTGMAFFGLTWWFVVCGLILSLLKKDSKMLFIAVCLIIPFIGFEFGFQSLREGILIVKGYPYLSLLTGPAMVIGAYFLYHLKQTLLVEYKTKFLIVFFTVLIIGSMNLYGTYRLYVNGKNDAAPYIAVADYLKKIPGGIIYTHHGRWPLFLGYFLRYDPSYKFRDLNNLNKIDINKISDAYAVLNKRYIEADFIGRPIPQDTFVARYAKSPPHNWIKVLSFAGKPSYNSVDIYYIQNAVSP